MSQPAGGRYDRSFSGLVAALIVTLLCVLAFVLWRSIFRADVNVEPDTVDYLESVQLAETANLRVVHPPRLPKGWRATSVTLSAGDRPVWGLGVLTDEGRFVGVRQENASVKTLVETYIDKDATDDGNTTLATAIEGAETPWNAWSDEGGDHGFTTEITSPDGNPKQARETLLVYGSAPVGDIKEFAALLTR